MYVRYMLTNKKGTYVPVLMHVRLIKEFFLFLLSARFLLVTMANPPSASAHSPNLNDEGKPKRAIFTVTQ